MVEAKRRDRLVRYARRDPPGELGRAGSIGPRDRDRTGISAAYISSVERGSANPSLYIVVQLCVALECSIADMLRPDEGLSASGWLLLSKSRCIRPGLYCLLRILKRLEPETPRSSHFTIGCG